MSATQAQLIDKIGPVPPMPADVIDLATRCLSRLAALDLAGMLGLVDEHVEVRPAPPSVCRNSHDRDTEGSRDSVGRWRCRACARRLTAARKAAKAVAA